MKEAGKDAGTAAQDVGTTVAEGVKSIVDFVSLVLDALAKARVDSSLAGSKYVSRPFYESQIKAAVTNPEPSVYDIVYGAKGVGKSELVSHCVVDDPNEKVKIGPVKKFKVKSASTDMELIASVMEQLTGETTSLGTAAFESLLDKFIAEKKVIPTFIFDVERGSGTNTETYEVIRSFAKDLLCKCRCIIVLSEASAVMEFTGDQHRERFIFVDEMDTSQADELLKNCGATFSDAEKKSIYEKVGTNPSMLKSMVNDVKIKKMKMEDCIKLILEEANSDLKNFPLQPILAALKKNPNGVSINDFDGMKCGNVNLSRAKEVGAVMREISSENPLVYRKELRQFQLISTAHKTALKTYNPRGSGSFFNIFNFAGKQ